MREEWEDILVSVRSDKEMDCESAWSCRYTIRYFVFSSRTSLMFLSRTHSTQHQPSLIVSTRRAQTKPATITAGLSFCPF